MYVLKKLCLKYIKNSYNYFKMGKGSEQIIKAKVAQNNHQRNKNQNHSFHTHQDDYN